VSANAGQPPVNNAVRASSNQARAASVPFRGPSYSWLPMRIG